MYKYVLCIGQQHSPSILVLAALICLISSYVSVVLLRHSRDVVSHRNAWLLAAGFAAGSGVWSTHFLAMLAYDAELTVTYAADWTCASLVMAISASTAALALARTGWRWSSIGAGCLFGLGIGATHNLGTLSIVLPGHFLWDSNAVVLADAAIVLLATLAFASVASDRGGRRCAIATALIFASVFLLHFVGMAYATVVPDPTVAVQGWVIPRLALALAIAGLMISALTVGAAALVIDVRVSSALHEAQRMGRLADATMEGVVILRDDRIADVNRSLLDLIGRRLDELVDKPVSTLFASDPSQSFAISDGHLRVQQWRLVRAGGADVPVEVRRQTVEFADGPRSILAVRDLREQNAAEARIWRLAHHDSLTGLLNRESLRAILEAEIEIVQAQGQSFALHCLDLDRFKAVNDRHGHPVGDELLRMVALRLTSLLRNGDVACRLGGDEFVILQKNLTGAMAAHSLANRVLDKLNEPYSTGGLILEIGVSIGVAICPDHGCEPDALLKNADDALYVAKRLGRGRVALAPPAPSDARAQMSA